MKGKYIPINPRKEMLIAPAVPISHERITSNEIGIYNETHRLKKATVWGPIGVEAYLAQLYPSDISLFYDFMNVKKARKEGLDFAVKLKENGVETILVRDELASLLPPPENPLSKDIILNQLIVKAQNAQNLSGQFRPQLQKDIADLVNLDIERYGEQTALNLIKRLCLNEELPLGNLIFARDQMNVLLETRFVSHMSKPIREGEVDLYELVYRKILGQNHNFVEFPKDTDTKVYRFEGGDAYIHNGVVYIGVGVRTTRDAAIFVYETLRPQLDALGLKFAIVEDLNPEERSQRDQMDFMHLDTFSNPIGKNQIVVCEEEAKIRKVSWVVTNGVLAQLVPDLNDKGDHIDFVEHLSAQGNKVITISKKEQSTFGCNFLALDENTILMPLETNYGTNKKLNDAGKTLIYVDLEESTKGYGAAHCMTGQLLREARTSVDKRQKTRRKLN